MAIKTIAYLDMDGTLADFSGAALKLVGFDGVDFKDLSRNQMTADQKSKQDILFKFIDENPDFFKQELPYSYAQDLYNLCKNKFDIVKILSSYCAPKNNPGVFKMAEKYKTDWIHEHIDANLPDKDIIVTDQSKHLWAKPTSWLIDDMPNNIQKWISYKGKGILFDNWNNVSAQLMKYKGK